mgnify:CR=1 FL=1
MATKPPKLVPQNPVVPVNPDTDGTVVLERRTQKTRPPAMYQVVMLNDDYTPMEFVVHVLERFFGKGRDEATRIMLHVHQKGVGVYSRDIAVTKVDQVLDAANRAGHPLQCVAEPVGS